MKRGSRPGPAPVPVIRSLWRLRWLLTVWFTLVFTVGVVALVAITTAVSTPVYGAGTGSSATDLVWLLAVLGALAAAVLGPVTWVLLGYVLAPVTRTLSAQESFLSAAAHDLRTPIATLTALVETARRDPDQRDDALERAARLTARSGGIVEDLLLRARLAVGSLPVQPRPMRLDQLVEGVIADLASTEPEPVTGPADTTMMAIDVDGHRITMTARPTVALIDPALTERAIANLVHNALRHGHQPGRPARITVTVDSRDGRALVTVADDGPGLRLPLPSSGLGLSVVRWVVRAHGGSLLLGTGPQPGTRIRVALTAVTQIVQPPAT